MPTSDIQEDKVFEKREPWETMNSRGSFVISTEDSVLLKLALENIDREEDNDLESETTLALNLDSLCQKLKSYWSENCNELSGEDKIAMMEQLILAVHRGLNAQIERLFRMAENDNDKAAAKRQQELNLLANLIAYLDSLKEYLKLVSDDPEKRQSALKEISKAYQEVFDGGLQRVLPAEQQVRFAQDATEFAFETCVSLQDLASREEQLLFSQFRDLYDRIARQYRKTSFAQRFETLRRAQGSSALAIEADTQLTSTSVASPQGDLAVFAESVVAEPIVPTAGVAASSGEKLAEQSTEQSTDSLAVTPPPAPLIEQAATLV